MHRRIMNASKIQGSDSIFNIQGGKTELQSSNEAKARTVERGVTVIPPRVLVSSIPSDSILDYVEKVAPCEGSINRNWTRK